MEGGARMSVGGHVAVKGSGPCGEGSGCGRVAGGEVGWVRGDTWRGFSGWEWCLLCVDGVGVIKIGLGFFLFFFFALFGDLGFLLSLFFKKR